MVQGEICVYADVFCSGSPSTLPRQNPAATLSASHRITRCRPQRQRPHSSHRLPPETKYKRTLNYLLLHGYSLVHSWFLQITSRIASNASDLLERTRRGWSRSGSHSNNSSRDEGAGPATTAAAPVATASETIKMSSLMCNSSSHLLGGGAGGDSAQSTPLHHINSHFTPIGGGNAGGEEEDDEDELDLEVEDATASLLAPHHHQQKKAPPPPSSLSTAMAPHAPLPSVPR